MTTYDANFWEKQYQSADPSWGTTPNAPVVATIPRLHLQPGRALELGAGHGGDALWLAAQGWAVTALDVAQTAVDRIARRAAEEGLAARVTAVRRDVTVDPLPTGPFDLVWGSFFYAPDREAVLRRAAESVNPGGALLIVDHGSVAPWSWSSASDHELPTPAELAESLGLGPDWTPEVLEAPKRIATGPNGQRAEVTDTIVGLRRAQQP
ncbi:class I SAM-dependent methyltransferase [Actinoalloteichus sp. AHMU CJ021]|uniref:Methyltransferase domain-containing protein n=1 Tax=Actinoalloteichus caeruleus DSM 43889 TaxID=1120930 RepID=A0ABT1JFX5_ACTCY|nr:class I SAM-dependent methyltransferase [Actinoalloteichus caeruleus]AUS81399.1 class I SAM-dependent methyltransferase [Actinoalloteichus sp. AHMU CJ021]MCP2331189.1 Methyltransferase domain-containing protein [Actinoalloteichus caeruleus DSM 43889]